jgi:hypothetical protein
MGIDLEKLMERAFPKRNCHALSPRTATESTCRRYRSPTSFGLVMHELTSADTRFIAAAKYLVAAQCLAAVK